MSSTKKDNIVKENINQFKESTDNYLAQQRQQYTDTASNISQTTEKINESVYKFQDDNRGSLKRIQVLSGNLKNKLTKQIKKYQTML